MRGGSAPARTRAADLGDDYRLVERESTLGERDEMAAAADRLDEHQDDPGPLVRDHEVEDVAGVEIGLVAGVDDGAEGEVALEPAVEEGEAEPAALRDDADAAPRRIGAQAGQGGEVDRPAEGRGERLGEGEQPDRVGPGDGHAAVARDGADSILQRTIRRALLP